MKIANAISHQQNPFAPSCLDHRFAHQHPLLGPPPS